jgi:SAM-dependent methyltransferase
MKRMTGFSADWLALREEADHAARNEELGFRVASHLASHECPLILDLGCGTGSNLRALAPLLGRKQYWHLIDLDAGLLAHAKAQLRAWADYAEVVHNSLVLYWGEQQITVDFSQTDINKDLPILFNKPPQLITAAAFFDLVSEQWIADFAQQLVQHSTAFYTVLTYDGEEQWHPPYPEDRTVLAAFHRHQGLDKGFGPAAGPKATTCLQQAFSQGGYEVMTAPSPWHLNAQEHPDLMLALGQGIGEAAAHFASADAIHNWTDALHYRRHAVIGHLDLFAKPIAG